MLLIEDNPIITMPVKVLVHGDGGVPVESEFKARFRLLPPADYDQHAVVQLDGAVAEVLRNSAGQLQHFLDGWDGVVRTDGTAIEFSQTALESVLQTPHGVAISRALWSVVHQVHTKAPAKN